MPLSTPVERELIHHRSLNCKSYQRQDGLLDIEGHLLDVKSYDFDNFDRGKINAGEPVHEMWLRLTIDEDMFIHEAEAITDASPYFICPNITDNFIKLKGIQIKHGWRKHINKIVGTTLGCTHLVELLPLLGTIAFQTTYLIKSKRDNWATQNKKPDLLESCHVFATDSPIVKREWPKYYDGED